MKRDWIQLLTNLAVVIGLVLLIYELNQSRNLTRAQVVDQVYGAAVLRNLSLMGESPEKAIAKSVFRRDEITESDAIILTHFYTSLLVSWLRNRDERGVGYFGSAYEQVIQSEVYFINTVPGRTWWSSVRNDLDPDIVEAVDSALRELTPEGQKEFVSLLLPKGKAPLD